MKFRLIFLLLFMTAVLPDVSAGNRRQSDFGPWIVDMSETGFSVCWVTRKRAVAWVEIAPDDGTAFYAGPRRRIYHTCAGRRVADTFHKVEVDGLEKGTSYRYRLCTRAVVNDNNAYAMKFEPETAERDISVVRTFDTGKDTCRFVMLCDIHERDGLYASLVSGVDASKTDFLLLNGDITSKTSSVSSLLFHTLNPAAGLLRNVPLVYSRGNHEGRGRDFHKLPEYFPAHDGGFYYTFRQGPVAFVVLDAGEDKPDTDVEYSGTAEYDAYRIRELSWLRSAVRNPDFADAPLKVAVMHIPVLGNKDAWYTQKWVTDNFMPVLNEAGVDLMLSGHHHMYIYAPAGEFGNAFPVVVNDDTDRLEFEASPGGIRLRMYDASGYLAHSIDL
ncbi:MAG: metallophosphoesterase family protein [Candidatus Cryptobacteroides sp.]